MLRQLIMLSVIAPGFSSALVAEMQIKPAQKEEAKAPPAPPQKKVKPAPRPQPFNAERVNKAGRGRYGVSTFEVVKANVFTQPEYNGNANMLDGLGKGTAEELELSGEEVYNEYPGQGGVRVVLHPKAVVYYDTASRLPLYLDGCLRKGKPWVNRIKLVKPPPVPEKPPPPPPKPAALEVSCSVSKDKVRVNEEITFSAAVIGGSEPYRFSWSGDATGQDKELKVTFATGGRKAVAINVTDSSLPSSQSKAAICSVVVEVPPLPPVTREEPKPCVDCSDFNIKVEFWTPWWMRTPIAAFTSWKRFLKFVPTVATGWGIAYGLSSEAVRWGAANKSGLYSTAAYFGANAVNPDEIRARVKIGDRKVVETLKRGRGDVLFEGGGGKAIWDEEGVKAFLSDGKGGFLLCRVVEPGKKLNFTPVAVAETIGLPQKEPFFNPGNLARPVSGPIGLVSKPFANGSAAPVASQIGKWSGRLLVRALQ